MAFVGRREVFARTGRLHFILLRYLCGLSAFGGPDVRNLVSYSRESVYNGLKEISCAVPRTQSLCEISPQQQSSMNVIVSFLVLIESNY
jgi:hypothetical protein